MDKKENTSEGTFLKKHAEVINSNTTPPARFGHTVNLVSKTTVVIFGGAISSPGNYTMTTDLYLYNMATNVWKKLERKYFLLNYSSEQCNASCSGSSCFCNS